MKGLRGGRSLWGLEQTPWIILEHHTFAVTALVYNEFAQGAFMQHVVCDDAVVKVFANDAVGRAPHSPAAVVTPGVEIVAHASDTFRSLHQDMR